MSSTITRTLRARLFVVGEVLETEQVTPRMRRIRIGGQSLAGLRCTPGQHVRLLVNDLFSSRTWLSGAVRDALRTYSVWRHDPLDTIDLIGFDHGGDTPGASWIRNAHAGQEVAFTRPEGTFVTRPAAAYHLFAGEETASVALGAMLRGLPEHEKVFGVVEADRLGDHLELPRHLVRICRDGASAADSERLVQAIRQLDLPEEPGVAYLAGEARTIQAARAHLVTERGWPRRNVLTKPFWTPGRRGLD